MNKNFGFTLAEVLITLGIIGVVSALTIPTLVNKCRETIVANKLKKTYAELLQAIKLSELENDDFRNWDYSLDDSVFAEKYIMPYLAKSYTSLKGGRISGKKLDGSSSFFGSFDNKYYYLDKSISIGSTVNKRDDINDIQYATITVDLNADSGPNVLGNDIFMFTLFNYTYYFGAWNGTSVCPKGEHYGLYLGSVGGYWGSYCATSVDDILGEDDVRGDCKIGKIGTSCVLAIQKNGWKVPKGYPIKF
jgi:prepilin-type N-terminal cleavage/methylation domain-containing protein